MIPGAAGPWPAGVTQAAARSIRAAVLFNPFGVYLGRLFAASYVPDEVVEPRASTARPSCAAFSPRACG